jgi:hypothetical protein
MQSRALPGINSLACLHLSLIAGYMADGYRLVVPFLNHQQWLNRRTMELQIYQTT